MADASKAQKRFEMENNISTVSDDIYKYDHDAQMAIRDAKPWKKDPHYFTQVKLSGVALVKMVRHSCI
jgi:COP9 signalosome complex subunit 5